MAQPLLYNVDWLGISLRLAGEVKPIDGYVWREYTATNVWAKRWILYSNDGDKILTLLFEPRSTLINSQFALVEIENEWLYHGGGYPSILELLNKSVFYEVMGLSRLDLCVDFCPTPAQKSIILGLADGEYYVGGKQSGSGFWSTSNNEKLSPMWNRKKIPHCQSWGHKTSDIKWKLYYKTKELLDAGGGKFMSKPYIIDQWRIHDMDITNVWRLEVSIKHLNNYSVYGHPVNLDWLYSSGGDVFVQMYNNRFKVKCNEGHRDRSNDKEVTFLPLPDTMKAFVRNEPKGSREHSGRITLLRHLVASLDDEQVLFDKPSRLDVFSHIYSLIERDNLQNYFYSMTGMWYDEFIAMKENESQGKQAHDVSKKPLFDDLKPNCKAFEMA